LRSCWRPGSVARHVRQPDHPRRAPGWIGSDASTIAERILVKIERWMDRLIIPDDRYVCGACDDRFVSRSQGVAHVLRCHPEIQGVVVYEDDDRRFAAA
jgi:hypothetical protein